MSMTFSTQLFLGAKEKKNFSFLDIKSKISRVNDSIHLKKLMVWDTNPSDETKALIDFCHNKGIETYLWHPVFADINSYEITIENMGQIPYKNGIKDLSGIWDKIGKGEEKFLFIDPGDKKINNLNFRNFKKLIKEYNYDGVFLDRIRFPSPTNGLESIFSTFLTSYPAYCNRNNIDFDYEKMKLSNFFNKVLYIDDSKLGKLDRIEDLFEGFKNFFQYKKEQIYNVVCKYKTYASINSIKIGLDLLSPSLSFFTGQDYSLLSTQCDWIKTMSYCYAKGPAALPLEIMCLVNGLKALSPQLTVRVILRLLSKSLGLQLPDNLKNIEEKGVNPSYAIQDLEKSILQTNGSIPIYSGLEMVNSPYFSTKITEEMLNKYLDSLQFKAKGIIASWNILYIPDSHFATLGRRFV